jgi:hypothetical protein
VVTAFATARGLEILHELEEPLRALQQLQFALLSDQKLDALIGGLEKVRESVSGEH